MDRPQTRPLSDWRRLRDEAGLSCRELSRLSGVTLSDVNRIENGRVLPTAAEARAILAAIDAAMLAKLE